MKLKDNTILLTGGTSGIGLEFLERFYELENNLIVTSGNPANLDNLKSKFPKILTIVCDLADSSSVRDLISKCLKEHTDINILINNAGVQYNYDWTKETDGYNKIESETRINFISPMQIIYGLLPILINKHDSAIVNVSSGLAIVPKKQAPIYCATKAAIHNGTVALRIQLEDKPTKIFEILPPMVETAMTAGRGTGKITTKQLADEFFANFKNDKLESNIGKVKILRIVSRISPKLAQKIMNKISV